VWRSFEERRASTYRLWRTCGRSHSAECMGDEASADRSPNGDSGGASTLVHCRAQENDDDR
jgi:hypothetical protein